MRPGRRRWWRRTICLVLMWGTLAGSACFFCLACALALLYALAPGP